MCAGSRQILQQPVMEIAHNCCALADCRALRCALQQDLTIELGADAVREHASGRQMIVTGMDVAQDKQASFRGQAVEWSGREVGNSQSRHELAAKHALDELNR